MNLFALSFDRDLSERDTRHYLYKFVPITIEQARGCYTVKEIPTGAPGTVIELTSPRSGKPVPFMTVGVNQFRELTFDEFLKRAEEQGG